MILGPQDLFERAKAALMAGDLTAAAVDARAVLKIVPEAWPALHLLAVAERDSGRFAPARKAFEAALLIAPENPDIHANYAELLDRTGDRAKGLEHHRQAAALRPGQVEGWLKLSLAAHAAGQDGEARRAVEAAVRAGPNDPTAWAMLGARRHADGDGDAAAEALQRAVGLAPQSGPIVRALAELEADRGGEEAIALFDRAARLDPRDAETVLQRAGARRRAGDEAGGRAELEALAAATPGWIAPLEALAKLAISDGRMDDARAVFTAALAARRQDRDLWGAYLQTLAKLEDYSRVLTAVGEARKALGDHPVLDGYLATALDATGDHEQAGRILRRLDEADDGQAFAEARVANLLRAGKIEAAARRAQAGAGKPGGEGLWAYLATTWRMLGDPRWAWLEAPEFVQVIEIEDGVAVAAAAEPVLRRMHTARAAPLGQTIRGGSQTEGHLFLRREPEIQALARALKSAIEAYVADLPPPEPDHPLLSRVRSPVRFSGSWSVRLTPGGLHVNHIHPDGWLSSAFYLSLPPTVPASTEGWLALGEPPKSLGLDLEPYKLIEPKPGRLALFPSYTWHGTRPFGAGERLTVAFDVVAG